MGRPPSTQTKISFLYESLERKKDNDQFKYSCQLDSLFKMWLQIQMALDISNIVGNCAMFM